jgi:hypothetical protein
MLWAEIRQAYPNQWLIIEALEAHTTPDKQRHLDCLAVLDKCPDGSAALQRYRHLHQQYSLREFYFVHTSRAELDIRERAMPFMNVSSHTVTYDACEDMKPRISVMTVARSTGPASTTWDSLPSCLW